jgi:hypothetical protein
MTTTEPITRGTGLSAVVDRCQVCAEPNLEPVLFLGYLPPVNTMPRVGQRPAEQPSYPAQLLRCPTCQLFQLGLVVDPAVLFPPDYPYTSGTTRILRENFAQLRQECRNLVPLAADDLVIDIGSNDGTLLSNFAGESRVLGIEPVDVGRLAVERGIPTVQAFFTREVAEAVRREHGPAALVTATNVFAHIEQIHEVVEGIVSLLGEDGVFISESHYAPSLIETLQYDTIYHEHLRYYSLESLSHLLRMHGLSVFHAARIPTHGGSIRVYASRSNRYALQDSVGALLEAERRAALNPQRLAEFRRQVVESKLALHALLLNVKRRGGRIAGIGAPSRASTLINYVGLDEGIIDYVCEVQGSHKIGRYMPGTLIPVVEESALFRDQPDCALLFSWHIAEELIPKLTSKGYRGRFIVPLPSPRLA